MAELKQCPFCGRIPKVEDCGTNRFFVKCECGVAQDKLYFQRCDAVRRWNTRKATNDEPSIEAIKEYCHKRCLSIVDNALLKKYASAQPNLQLTCNQLATDSISRQAAIDYIRTMIPKDARLDIKWIEMWLMQLPSAQPEQRWIPCSERLPKESVLYLVTGGLNGTEVCSRYYNVRDDGGFWSGHPYDAVIAWMPLPEPYKGR